MYIKETPEEKPITHKVTVTKPTVRKPDIVTAKYGIAPPVTPNSNTVSAVPIKNPVSQIAVPEINVGDKVRHKKFGEGTIKFTDKAQKKLRVEFPAGEKLFVYPDAFLNGFLTKTK